MFVYATFPGTTTLHHIGIKTYLCPARNRGPGFKVNGNDTNRASGPVTDYAINNRLNNPANNAFFTNGGSGNVADGRTTIQTIHDGSSNTILVGGKALRIPKHADTSGTDWDECITQGGWGGTGRGGTNNTSNSATGVANFILVRDSVTNTPIHNNHFGGGFSSGVLFVMGDGSVRTIGYGVDPALLRNALNPSDGQSAGPE